MRGFPGSHAGRLLWRNNVLATAENIRWLKDDLHTCGVTLEKLSDLPANLGRLLDLKIEVSKRTRGEFSNIYLNRLIAAAEPQSAGADTMDDIPW